MKYVTLVFLLILATILSFAGYAQNLDYPVSQQIDNRYTKQGKEFTDPFMWLENVDSKPTQKWAAEQNQLTEGLLNRAEFEETQQNILKYSEFLSYRQFNQIGENQFYLKGWSGTTTAALYVESVTTGKVRRIAGPELVQKQHNGQPLSLISRFWVSKDGKYVIASQNKMGERWATLILISVDTGKVLQQIKEGVYVGLSQVSWSQKDNQFLVSLFEKDQQGKPQNVRLQSFSVGNTQSRTVYRPKTGTEQWLLTPVLLNGSNEFVVHQRNGSEVNNRVFLLDLDKPAVPPQWLFEKSNASRLLLGNRGSDLYFYSDEQAENGKVIRVNQQQPKHQQTIIEQTANPIANNSSVGGNAVGMFGSTIALTYLDAGRYRVRGYDLTGKLKFEFNVPDSGSVWGGFNGVPEEDTFYFGFLGVGEPSSIYAVSSDGTRTLVKSPELPFDMQITARRVYVESESGTNIPVLIAHRKGLDLSQPKPVIHYAYGGFGWVSFLWYQAYLIEWFNRDGIYVISGVRGGGEYGSHWHQAGIKQNRQNAINDYIATSKWLIAKGIANPGLLIANGGSLSGALIGAAVLQQPELFGLALIDFPVMDMLRYDQFGHAKYWQSEFGSPENKDDFDALLNYSPYHALDDAQCLPPTLVRTGEFDQTTTPMHGFKFVAKAQQKARCKQPVLLDVMEGAGHNYGATPAQFTRSHALALTFIRSQLSLQNVMEATR